MVIFQAAAAAGAHYPPTSDALMYPGPPPGSQEYPPGTPPVTSAPGGPTYTMAGPGGKV